MEPHGSEVREVLVSYSDLRNNQKIWLQTLDRIRLLTSNKNKNLSIFDW
jgi:predicted RNA-binding protein (virulence factor B family)